MHAPPVARATALRNRWERRTLAAGLQDAWLGRSPVIALTGRKPSAYQHRNAYQEIPHRPLYAPVTKFSAEVDQAEDLPRLLRQAWRAAMSGSPRPAHLDLNGHLAEIIEAGTVSEPAWLSIRHLSFKCRRTGRRPPMTRSSGQRPGFLQRRGW